MVSRHFPVRLHRNEEVMAVEVEVVVVVIGGGRWMWMWPVGSKTEHGILCVVLLYAMKEPALGHFLEGEQSTTRSRSSLDTVLEGCEKRTTIFF